MLLVPFVTLRATEHMSLYPQSGECPILCVGMTEKERHVYEGQDRRPS